MIQEESRLLWPRHGCNATKGRCTQFGFLVSFHFSAAIFHARIAHNFSFAAISFFVKLNICIRNGIFIRLKAINFANFMRMAPVKWSFFIREMAFVVAYVAFKMEMQATIPNEMVDCIGDVPANEDSEARLKLWKVVSRTTQSSSGQALITVASVLIKINSQLLSLPQRNSSSSSWVRKIISDDNNLIWH